MANDFIALKDITLPWQSKYPVKVGVIVEWPSMVEHKGKVWFSYNKFATDRATGIPCACYKYIGPNEDQDCRIWLHLDGRIEED